MADEEVVSVREAAARLGLTERQVRHLVEKGALNVTRVQFVGARQALCGVHVPLTSAHTSDTSSRD
jgi:excisionase family DNA binding protein